MQRGTITLSYAAAAIAFLAWVFVIWFAFSLQGMQAERLSDTQRSASASSKDSQAATAHAELQETESERAQLQSLINVDPTTLADTIDQAGTAAGVAMQIQSAAPETQSSASEPTQAFDFSLAAQGSFAQLLYAESLLETLPVPSSIQNFQLIRAPQNAALSGGAWQFNGNVRIITASNISS